MLFKDTLFCQCAEYKQPEAVDHKISTATSHTLTAPNPPLANLLTSQQPRSTTSFGNPE